MTPSDDETERSDHDPTDAEGPNAPIEGADTSAEDPPTEGLRRAVEAGDLEAATRLLRAIGPLYGLPGARRAGGGLTADGDFVSFYFTDPGRALDYAREHDFLGREEDADPPRVDDPFEPLRQARDEDFAGVVLDPGSSRPLPLPVETIHGLLSHSERTDDDGEVPGDADAGAAGEGTAEKGRGGAAPSPSAGGGTPPPPPHLLDLAQRVRRSPPLDPVPPPDRSPAEARELIQELRELAMDDRMPVWEVVDTLAYEIAFHVPVAPEPAHGLRWPLTVRHPRDSDSPSVWVFTDPDRARRSLDQLPGKVETLRLSGLEAFRWIWAVPTPVPEVVVDLYPDSPPPLFVPDSWMLGALYPHFLDCPDLRRVGRVPRDGLGSLPGARGTKLEAIRALTEPWIDLTGAGAAADAPPRMTPAAAERADPATAEQESELVRHDGGRYLPARPSGAWTRASSPPFRAWLRASSDHSGVLLNPESEAPLALDHADLAILALWAESGSQPRGEEVAALVEELREDLGPATAGRILADWPRWFWALQGGGEDEPTRAMTLADRDTCPVFSSEDRIRAFLEQVREGGLVSGEMQPLAYLSGWAFNVFREIHVRYREGGWLDPEGPRPETGLEMGAETIRAALARIEWRLQPRVPGFLANP